MQNTPKYILVHTTDVSRRTHPDQFALVDNYHRDVRGFNRSALGYHVGYHVLITGGKAYKTRIDTEYGNHCNNVVDGLSMNFQSLGIAIGFDGDIEFPDDTQVALLREQIQAWQDTYRIPTERVLFHRDFTPLKTCPGSLITRPWLEQVLRVVPSPKPKEQGEKQQAQIANMEQQISLLKLVVELLLKLKMLR